MVEEMEMEPAPSELADVPNFVGWEKQKAGY